MSQIGADMVPAHIAFEAGIRTQPADSDDRMGLVGLVDISPSSAG